MKTKFTPGPWKVVGPDASGIRIQACVPDEATDFVEFKLRSDIPTTIFSDVWRQFPSKEWDQMQKANASLIAAAPEMYTELERCLTLISDKHPYKDEIIKRVEKLLAKARGESN